MYRLMFFLLFTLNSCNYPDIDTVPEFLSVNISMEEEIDKCKISNIFKLSKKNNYLKHYMNNKYIEEGFRNLRIVFIETISQEDCYEKINHIINRL